VRAYLCERNVVVDVVVVVVVEVDVDVCVEGVAR
jgi:hypothetical protein